MSQFTDTGLPGKLEVVRFALENEHLFRRNKIMEGPSDARREVHICHIYPTIAQWEGRLIGDEVNPRSHEEDALKGKVANAIEETLELNPWDFYLANRGITVLAENVKFDSQRGVVEITMRDTRREGAIHGVADGGTTDGVIARVQREWVGKGRVGDLDPSQIPEKLRQARVHVEVIVGVGEDRIPTLVEGRNTSRQVKSWTMEDFKGAFDWIRAVLERPGGPFAGKVGYEENAGKPVNILEVISILTLFHKSYNVAGKAPTVAYSSRGRMDKKLTNKEMEEGYKALAPILEEILHLHGYVYENFNAAYKKARPRGKPGRVGGRENKIFPTEKTPLPLTGGESVTRVPLGVLYPLLQSLRALVRYEGGKAYWVTNPREFFKAHGGILVDVLLGQLEFAGSNPNTLGKARQAYETLYDKARLIAYDEIEKHGGSRGG